MTEIRDQRSEVRSQKKGSDSTREIASMEAPNDQKAQRKAFYHADGVTYFDKRTERAIFFVLTIIMLVCGIFAKLGMF